MKALASERCTVSDGWGRLGLVRVTWTARAEATASKDCDGILVDKRADLVMHGAGAVLYRARRAQLSFSRRRIRCGTAVTRPAVPRVSVRLRVSLRWRCLLCLLPRNSDDRLVAVGHGRPGMRWARERGI
jgi:hypothetical protein